MAGRPVTKQKMRNNFPVVFFFVGFLLAAMVAVPAHGSNPTPENLAREFHMTKIKLMKDEVRQREILGRLYEINKNMKKIVTEKTSLEQEKLLVESNVHDLAGKITELDQKTKSQKMLLRGRLSAIYKLGGQGIARFLFSSTSSAELERSLKILGIVAKQDLELIKSYSKSVKELDSRKRKFQLRWTHLKDVERKIQNKENSLLAENQNKNKILSEVRLSQNASVNKLSKIKKQSLAFVGEDESGLLDLLFRPAFVEQRGQLPMPIDGHLAQGFGLMRDEVHRVVISHKGQFYSAPQGTLVKAIFSGKVAFAGEVPGFGITLIVDHGDHYYSVYSHTRDLKVHEGDEVQQLQTLASSGRSGSGFGDGIYFEIRHFSEPADPKQWMKGSSL